MTSHNWRFLVVIVFIALPQIRGAIIDHEKYRNNTANSIQEAKERPTSWLQTAQDVMASPAGHVVSKVAKELINRSAGNSHVLSLNLNNLIIIVLLKVLIFAAALLGAGHWTGGYAGHGYGYGRSSDGTSLGVNEGEDYLITGFLAAQGIGHDDCLYASACASPKIAYEYAKAAKALKQGIEQYDGNSLNNTRYDDLIGMLEKAAYDGYNGVPCNRTAKCDNLL